MSAAGTTIRGPARISATPPHGSPVATPTPLVLVVDDDPVQRKMMTVWLLDAGYDVETAGDCEEALELARRVPPDAILSDVLMGEIDGFGLCRRVRADPSLSAVPVVLMSSHYDRELGESLAIGVGASGLVTRTEDFSAELVALERCLGPRPRTPRPALAKPSIDDMHLRTHSRQLTRLAGQARSAEERFRMLFDNANDAISILSEDGTILEANQQWHELLGVDPADLIHVHVNDFAPRWDQGEHDSGFRSAVERGSAREVVTLERADGRVIRVEVSLRVFEHDGERLVLSIAHDVTAREAAAEALAAAEEKYRSIVERVPDVLFTADAHGEVLFITPNVERLLGIRPEAALYGRDLVWAEHIHAEDLARARESYRVFAEEGGLFDLECRWLREDGRRIWIHARAVRRQEPDGQVFVDGMLTDVTEKRVLEQSLYQAQKMEAIGQLTGGIAHDFNNILAAILANAHFLMEDLAPSDARRLDAVEIKTCAERAAALTRQLLAFSRRQVLELTVVDLDAVLRGLEPMLRRLIGEDIAFSIEHGPALGATRADVGQIEQVIMNLAVNARDAMPSGGRLTVRTRNVDIDEVADDECLSVPPGRYVTIAIDDTGVGMDTETQRRIFEPFFTTKGLGKGTGLGLSTSFGIVKQSGGHIRVRSEPGRGSTFEIYLPRVDGAPSMATALPVRSDEHGRGETVLVVEDDDAMRAAVCRSLERGGYRVLVARDGEEAIERVRSEPGEIHVVLSDVIMPGPRGPEIVGALSASRPYAKVLFMSGYTDPSFLAARGLSSECSFIQKPFSAEALAQRLRQLIDG